MKYLLDVASIEFSPEECTGCWRCIEVCPRGVFEMNDKKAVITDRNLCMECGACANNCESGAIKVDSGVGCAYALITSKITGGEPSCDDCCTDKNSNNCC